MKKRNERGFTLIELLVVVGIIALLSSFIVAGLTQSQRKARNSKRLQEVVQYVKAAQIYVNTYGEFPDAGGTWLPETYRCLGRGDSDTCFAGGYTGDSLMNSQFRQYMNELSAGNNAGLALEGYAYSCGAVYDENISPPEPCLQYSILYQLEGTGQTCAGGLLINGATSGGNTYCQLIECRIGTKPQRSNPSNPNSAYVCR